MALTFEAFLWALTQQESGGNYRAVGVWVGGDRAYGRYQVMGANVGPWTAKYYGRRLTPQEFLRNNAAQDAVVRGVLGGYVKKYGYRGAASAWYSGNPNLHMSTRAQPGGPSIKGYVDSVMARAGTYTGTGSVTGSGGTAHAGTDPVTPRLDMDELAASFGLSSALINSNKELKALFQRAVREGWGDSPQGQAKFQAHLKNTKWWKTQPDSLRKYVTLKYTDPATWTQNRKEAAHKLNALAVQVGLGNQLKPGNFPTGLLDSAVYYSLALGWSDQRIKDWFGARVNLNGEFVGGEAGEAWDKLHELTYLNGLQFSTTWMKNNTRSLITGKTTMQTLEDYIRNTAAGRYSAYAEQIKAGMNVMDLAAPYIQSAATILELPESDVDLFNPHIAKAMTAKPGLDQPKGSGAQMPLWQFENELRNDPLWRKTNNARESMMSVARQVAKDFGLAY
ncbi:hypothetical protein ACGF5F_29595 [Streptomyces sp. NPDC047821]|uniref:hypothetical protein n=1 Tax=Streptomyces sp. NPDC047821 TaxID=3365488 RepID=UPI00371CBC1D